jgi:hypothetical protein
MNRQFWSRDSSVPFPQRIPFALTKHTSTEDSRRQHGLRYL